MVASAVRSLFKTRFHWDVRSQAASQAPTCCPHVARGCELLGTDCSFPGVDVTKAIPGDIPCTSAHSSHPTPPSYLGTASNLSHPLPASRQFANHFNPLHPCRKMKRILSCSHLLVARIKNSGLTLSQVPLGIFTNGPLYR